MQRSPVSIRSVAAFAAAASLVAAAPAAADSIAYIKGGDVYLATPDGSRQVQVTQSGIYSSVSQADTGEMVALAPNERLHKLSRDGKVLADFPTFASDGPATSGAVDEFSGPFDPQISPNGKLVAFEWYNDSYSGGTSSGCSQAAGCYLYSARKGVGITYSDRMTGYEEFGLLTGWSYPDWVDDDTLLRSSSGANFAEDAVFNEIGPGKGDKELDRWFYDPAGKGTAHDVEMSRDRKTVVALGGDGEELWVYRPLTEPFGAVDWKFSFFKTSNTPVVEYCYQHNQPVGGKIKGLTLAPDGKRMAYAVGDGIWVTDVADLSSGCGNLPTDNALKLPGGTSPDWGPADVPAVRPQPDPVPAPGPDPVPVKPGISLAGKAKLGPALARGLKLRVAGVGDGTPVRARHGGRVVATGQARGGTATLRFTRRARNRLRSARTAALTVTAGTARTRLRLVR